VIERLDPKTSSILVVDVQERLCRAMPEARLCDLERSARILLGAARELAIRVLATEQYPRGLGPTLPALAELLDKAGARRFEKLSFSACAADGFRDALDASGPRSVVLIGMEAHVCVFQTARDLAAAGYAVHVPVDGVSSRRDDHREIGIALCQRAGAFATTSETVLFDWLGGAGTDVFRRLSPLVKDAGG
jgi:nicotinamidase-related amidase